MEPTIIIPDHPPNPFFPYSTMGDESTPAQCPLRNPTEADNPHGGKTVSSHNPNSLSGDIGFARNDEEPPHPFRFLDLPLEIQLEVVDILSESYENRDLYAYMDWRGHPLLDLRQANKYLNLISTPNLFSKLNIPISFCDDLGACAATLGRHVKSVTIIIGQDREQPFQTEDDDGGPQRLCDDYGIFMPDHHLLRLLPYLPNITSLELVYPVSDDAPTHEDLLAQLAAYGPQITTVILRQQGLFSEHYDEVPQSIIRELFFDTLCHFVLQSFPNLRTFEVHSAVSFTKQVFAELRTTAQNLQKLFVRMGVGLALRPLFSEVTPWSCGIHGHLRELTLRDCKGGHLGIVASHLASGIFGAGLRVVNLVVCGYPTDDQYAPLGPPALGAPRLKVKWDERLVPKLDRVHVDHTEPWELWALSAIRTREVIITRSDRRCVVAMLERPGREDGEDALLATWVGLERLSVRDYAAGRQLLREERDEDGEGELEDETNQLGVAEYIELDQKLAAACNQRGVELAFDGLPWGRCSCHPEG